jgi:hypothetical protein
MLVAGPKACAAGAISSASHPTAVRASAIARRDRAARICRYESDRPRSILTFQNLAFEADNDSEVGKCYAILIFLAQPEK